MAEAALLDHFSALSDPRRGGRVVYPLPEIRLIVLCATLAGADDFVEIERWARRKLDFLRRLLPFARGVPSHDALNDALNDILNARPAALFAERFAAWVCRQRLVLGQQAVGGEGNPTPTLRQMLERDPAGAAPTATADGGGEARQRTRKPPS